MTSQEMVDAITVALQQDSNVILLLRQSLIQSLGSMTPEQLQTIVLILGLNT